MVLAALVAGLPGCKDKKAPAALGPDGSVPGVVTSPVLEEEVEPNDRPEQATAIPPGKLVQGRLKNPPKGRDVDFFQVTSAFPKAALRVEVAGVPGLDLVVSVFQKSPRKLLATANNGRAGAGEIVPNVGVGAGEYLIQVREAGKKPSNVEEPYTVRAILTAAAPGDELEPNDTRPDAQEVPVGETITGYYGRRRDVDWYRLRLPENVPASTLRLELTGLPSVPFASFSVQDEIEVVLKKGQTGRGTNVLFPNVAVRPGQRLVYLVTSAGKRYSAVDKYTITTKVSPAASDEEREPNDRPPQATPLGASEKKRGYIAPAGDEDWYALEVKAPSIARIAVTGVENVDLALSLHDAEGKERLRVDEGGLRDGEVIANAYLPAGRTLVRVSGKKRQENVFATYELVAELRPPEAHDEREPNDTAAQAGTLTLGGFVRGFIYPKRDVDLYRFSVPAVGPTAKTVRFDLRGIPKVPLALTLRDNAGMLVAKAGPKEPEEAVVLEKPLPAGVYTVEVSGGGVSNPRDAYELRVSP